MVSSVVGGVLLYPGIETWFSLIPCSCPCPRGLTRVDIGDAGEEGREEKTEEKRMPDSHRGGLKGRSKLCLNPVGKLSPTLSFDN